MSEQQQQAPQHADWKTEPGNYGIQHKIHRRGLVAYILGTGTNGKRYCRTVELSPEEAEALRRFETIFALVRTLGPSVCKELADGEDLPAEAEMPLLTKA